VDQINVGIIGYGLSGRAFHAPFIANLDQYSLDCIVSSRFEEIHEDFENVSVLKDPQELINDPNIDLIIIATPNITHFSLGMDALEAGKHVVIEKPFVVNVEEGRKLIQKAKEKNLVLSVYQNRRWDADFLTIKKLIADGRLNNIQSYSVHFDRFRPHVRDRWREKQMPGSGILYDLGAHIIDQALVLFGVPDWLQADVLAQRDGAQVDDYFNVTLAYGKMRVNLKGSCMVLKPSARYQIHTASASFVKSGIDVQEAALTRGENPRNPDWGREPEDQWGYYYTGSDTNLNEERIESLPGAYQDFYLELAQAIMGKAKNPVDPATSLLTIEIIQAALASSLDAERVYLDELKQTLP
jgi:scyllo-inositol 2-dehydrogenase (NADP+)